MVATRWGCSCQSRVMALQKTRIIFKEQGVYYLKSGNKCVEVTFSPPVQSLPWLRLGHVLLIVLSIANAWKFPFVQCKHGSAALEYHFLPVILNNAPLQTLNKLRKLDSAYHTLIIVTGTESRSCSLCSVSNISDHNFHWLPTHEYFCVHWFYDTS
jgi:hypothetical protein